MWDDVGLSENGVYIYNIEYIHVYQCRNASENRNMMMFRNEFRGTTKIQTYPWSSCASPI